MKVKIAMELALQTAYDIICFVVWKQGIEKTREKNKKYIYI